MAEINSYSLPQTFLDWNQKFRIDTLYVIILYRFHVLYYERPNKYGIKVSMIVRNPKSFSLVGKWGRSFLLESSLENVRE